MAPPMMNGATCRQFRCAAIPDAVALRPETVTDDQCCGLDRRDDAQPMPAPRSHGKAGMPTPARREMPPTEKIREPGHRWVAPPIRARYRLSRTPQASFLRHASENLMSRWRATGWPLAPRTSRDDRRSGLLFGFPPCRPARPATMPRARSSLLMRAPSTSNSVALSSMEKSTLVTTAFTPSAALLSFVTLISTVPGGSAPRKRSTCHGLVRGTHAHHGDELHLESVFRRERTPTPFNGSVIDKSPLSGAADQPSACKRRWSAT